ncbi:MAG: TIM barrel protein [Treponema sp.]|jgi:hypothetical protein|nr:TIM barrel protein [Treponema sp.]
MMHLTVPSWVIPGTYLENLRFLEDKSEINGVELLFFFYDAEVQALLDAEWTGIREYGRRFTFTVHLPDTLSPAHEDLITRLLPLARHYVLHPYPQERAETQERLIGSWAERFGSHRFLMENTYPGRLETILPGLPAGMGVCMDTGHLLLEGKNPAIFFKRYGDRIREIHLHGLDREKAAEDRRLPDHRPLRSGDPWLRELAPELAGFTGIINLEVFSWEEVLAGIAVLKAGRP